VITDQEVEWALAHIAAVVEGLHVE
jgi:hypothetical protein